LLRPRNSWGSTPPRRLPTMHRRLRRSELKSQISNLIYVTPARPAIQLLDQWKRRRITGGLRKRWPTCSHNRNITLPIRNDSDLTRIIADLATCRAKIASMEAGTSGVRLPDPNDCESAEQFQARNPHAGAAFSNQLNARRADLVRLQGEYVLAMIAEGLWSYSAIIEALEPKLSEVNT